MRVSLIKKPSFLRVFERKFSKFPPLGQFFPYIVLGDYNMQDQAFWDRIKILLKANKLTQKKFAEIIDLPLKTLERWIHFDRIPHTQALYNMAVALGVTTNYLLGGGEKEIAERRIKELEARETLSKVESLVQIILSETEKIKPLR